MANNQKIDEHDTTLTGKQKDLKKMDDKFKENTAEMHKIKDMEADPQLVKDQAKLDIEKKHPKETAKIEQMKKSQAEVEKLEDIGEDNLTPQQKKDLVFHRKEIKEGHSIEGNYEKRIATREGQILGGNQNRLASLETENVELASKMEIKKNFMRYFRRHLCL